MRLYAHYEIILSGSPHVSAAMTYNSVPNGYTAIFEGEGATDDIAFGEVENRFSKWYAKHGEPNPKLKLRVGGRYMSRNGKEWVCFSDSVKIHESHICIRVSDRRVEYFYSTGVYTDHRESEHDLLEEIKS